MVVTMLHLYLMLSDHFKKGIRKFVRRRGQTRMPVARYYLLDKKGDGTSTKP